MCFLRTLHYPALLSILGVILTVILAGCNSNEIRVMPLGASITAGLTVTPEGTHIFEGGYRRYLEPELDSFFGEYGFTFDFVGSQQDPATAPIFRKHHEGHPGWRIESIDQSAKQWVRFYQPDVVLLLVGTNDILQNYHLDQAPNRLDLLVTHLLEARSIKRVFVSSILPLADPDLDSKAQVFDAAIQEKMLKRQSEDQRVVWVDMYHDSGVTVQELGDGIHPNAEAYEKIAHVWYHAIEQAIPQPNQ